MEIAKHLEIAGQALESGRSWLNAGLRARRSGQLTASKTFLERAYHVLEGCDDQQADMARVKVWLKLGAVELALGNAARGKTLAAGVVKWARQERHRRVEGHGLLLLADVLRAEKNYQESIKAYTKAEQVLQEEHELVGVGHCLLGRGQAERGAGKLDEALVTLGRAAETLGENRDFAGQAQMFLVVGELYEERADLLSTSRAYGNAVKLFDEAQEVTNGLYARCLLGLVQSETEAATAGVALLQRLAQHPLFGALPDSLRYRCMSVLS